jgi:chemotaxis response regulator CheB
MTKKRILIVEDHPIFRLGLTELINQEEDLEVCAGAEDVANAWQAIEAFSPDLVVADITLPKGDGIDLTKEKLNLKHSTELVRYAVHWASRSGEESIWSGFQNSDSNRCDALSRGPGASGGDEKTKTLR